jgi:hypothetical protein
MLKALRRNPLLVGAVEVLADAVRYIAVMLIVIVLLGQVAELAL